jgi:ferrous iron transport protein A
MTSGAALLRLVDLPQGQEATLDHIDLPADDAQRLMELGFLPGSVVLAACKSPFGDPRVYRVDGSEVALRRETAKHLLLRRHPAKHRARS